MIYGFIGMSLLFVAIGLAVTEKNSKYILSGYNTMSEENRMKVDIRAYIPFFRKFHIFLGVSLLLIGSPLTYLISEGVGGIFLSVYPILAYIYFFVTSRKYSKGISTKGNTAAIVIMVGTLLFVMGMIGYGLKEDKLIFESQALVFEGHYAETLVPSEIQSIELVDQLPQITFKINGFGMGTVRKGYFRTKDREVVKLIINADQKPIILVTKMDGGKIFYSARSNTNGKVIKELKEALPKVTYKQ